MVLCKIKGIDVPRHCGLCFEKGSMTKELHEGVERLHEMGKKFL